jgi:hypothetical protein
MVGISPEVVAALVAAVATVLGSVATVVVGQNRSKRRELEEAHRQRKVEVYSKFIEGVTDVLRSAAGQGGGKLEKSRRFIDFFFKFTTDLILWGSPSVISAWSEFRDRAGESAAPQTLQRMEKLLRAIRADLGHDDRQLPEGAVVKLYLTSGTDFTSPAPGSPPAA